MQNSQYIFLQNMDDIAHEWGKYKNYTIRPLNSTISYYKKHINKYSHKNEFLIFGGTPEIRSIFQKLNFNVVLIDKSETIVRAMGKLTTAKCPISKNEIYIRMNWLSIQPTKSKFDLIIGDDAINMVHWEQYKNFLCNTSNLLNKNGRFICHLLVKPNDALINQTPLQLLESYNKRIIQTKYDLASRLNFICYDKSNYSMGWQQTINKLGKSKLDLFKPSFDYYETFKNCNSKFYCPPQYLFENLVQQFFSIEEVFYPHEHEYCQFEPVYVLKKRKSK